MVSRILIEIMGFLMLAGLVAIIVIGGLVSCWVVSNMIGG
jgi:hypothetical protein